MRFKSQVILDKSFDVIKDLNVGDKVQLLVKLDIVSERLWANEDDNDIKIVTLKVVEAEKVDSEDKRLT